MTRTLHVIDQPGEVADAALLRFSVDTARLGPADDADQHAWLLFGGEPMRDAARSVGLRDARFRLLPKPTGLHRLLPPALARPRRLMQDAHRVVCWTEGAAQIASLVGCAHVTRRVDAATLCPPAQRLIAQAHAATPQADRAALRQRWGVADDATVIALLGDRVDQVDAGRAMMTMALTYEALCAVAPDRGNVRLLLHPLARRRAPATHFGELLGLEHLLIQDAGLATPWSILPGCDVALGPTPADAGLSILWASAMGIPTITPAAARLPLLSELPNVVPARSNEPKHLADALTTWARLQVPV